MMNADWQVTAGNLAPCAALSAKGLVHVGAHLEWLALPGSWAEAYTLITSAGCQLQGAVFALSSHLAEHLAQLLRRLAVLCGTTA